MAQNQGVRGPPGRLFWLLGGLVAIGVLIGVLLVDRPRVEPVPPEQAGERVDLTLDADISADQLSIRGATDLPDGTLLSYEAQQVDDPQLRWHAEGHAEVRGGRFEETVSVADWEFGDVEVYVSFPSSLGGVQQPAGVVERFGERGERLTGTNVTAYDDGNRVDDVVVIPYRDPEEE